MNSWKSSGLAACAPPLSTLKCGTGSRGGTPGSARCSHSGVSPANSRAAAIDTPTIALAPSRSRVGVPSKATSAASNSAWSAQARPPTRSAISPVTEPTARSTPEPPYRAGSPSRSSTASRTPVDAPDGTPALPVRPSVDRSSTYKVGRPRESRISNASTALMRMVRPVMVCRRVVVFPSLASPGGERRGRRTPNTGTECPPVSTGRRWWRTFHG